MIGFRLFRSQMPSLLLYALFPRVKQKELTSFTINKEKAEGWKDGRAEGWKDGRAEGKAEAVIELLEDLGALSDSLKTCIMEQTDLDLLKKWHKAAAKAKSIEEFEQTIGLVQV